MHGKGKSLILKLRVITIALLDCCIFDHLLKSSDFPSLPPGQLSLTLRGQSLGTHLTTSQKILAFKQATKDVVIM